MIYTKEELKKFLAALDNSLSSKAEIIMIGGAAATLHYDSKGGTVDIDTYNSVRDLQSAYEELQKLQPEIIIPLQASAPAFAPEKFEERLENYTAQTFSKLKVLVPEIHDWVLLKTARCEEKDIVDIKSIAAKHTVNPDTLLERFTDEVLPINPGSDEDICYNYLYMISEVFNEQKAKSHEKIIEQSR